MLDWREDILKEAKGRCSIFRTRAKIIPISPTGRHRRPIGQSKSVADRQRKLIAKIDAALQRIEDGTYGYCEETGEPITLKRLEARPIATLSIEAQERHERRERVYRDD